LEQYYFTHPFKTKYGYWRNYITDVIYKYLDCGDLKYGFARVKCDTCNTEYLLPFSCKCRYFCPSCHQRRVIEFGEYLYEEILKDVPHRQWVFSIPKRIRPYFMYNRKLLSKLSKCAWKVLSDYLKESVSVKNAVPGVVVSIQTFGDFINFNPHLHIVATDGCFYNDKEFMIGNVPNPSELEEVFQIEVLKMLKKEGLITDFIIQNMSSWAHSGFNIYCGNVIESENEQGIEKLGRYIVRAPISQERMEYIPDNKSYDGEAKVIYKSKNKVKTKTFEALEWCAKVVSHIPNKGEQLVRYYGFYSNKSRGQRKKADTDNKIPSLVSTDISKKKFKKNWLVVPLCYTARYAT
jgi:hypothetical protein